MRVLLRLGDAELGETLGGDELGQDVARQLVQRSYSDERFLLGAWRFSLGLAKKVVLADSLAFVVDAAFGDSPATAIDPQSLSCLAAWGAAEGGAAVLTQSLGAEWAKYGILVNAVAPGPVETEGVLEVWKTPAMIAQAARDVPLQRLGRPEEIAWAVVFVASDQASFMTGETLYVSGGPRVANREDTK